MPNTAQRSMLDDDEPTIDELVAAFSEVLTGTPLAADPAELELVAATVLLPLEFGGVPDAVPDALLTRLEREADEGAAALLSAVAVIAAQPLAGRARAAAVRLEDAGVLSPCAGKVGTLTVREVVSIDGDGGELLIATLRRPGARKVQLALIGIEHEDTGGALASCLLTPPVGTAKARRVIADAAANRGSSAASPIAPAQLAERARAAAQRAVDLGIALDADSAAALPLIARALTGDPQGLARPEALGPWADDDPELEVDAAEDEKHFHAIMEELLGEFEQHATTVHPRSSPVWHSGDFVASCMLQWKGGYGDGRLGRWTSGDVAEFLLDYFPRKVSASAETIDAVPDCVIAFLGFLDTRGSLSGGETLAEIEQTCRSLSGQFRDCAADSDGWGLAKSMVMQMMSEGLDPEDPDALADWMKHFNARPAEERDAIIGGPMDRMLGDHRAPSRSGGSAAPKRRAQRKAQRSARKRNRRRG